MSNEAKPNSSNTPEGDLFGGFNHELSDDSTDFDLNNLSDLDKQYLKSLGLESIGLDPFDPALTETLLRDLDPGHTDAELEALYAQCREQRTYDLLYNPRYSHDTSIVESTGVQTIREAVGAGSMQRAIVNIFPKLKSVRDQISELQAMQHRLQAQLADAVVEQDAERPVTDMIDGNWRLMRSLVATSFNQSERTVESAVDESHRLVTRFPATLRALEDGHISAIHASRMVSAGIIIQDQLDRDEYEQRLLEVATSEPPARFTSVAKRVAEEYASETIDERHARARKRRGVELRMLDDGLASLNATLDASVAVAIKDRVNQFAKHTQAQTREELQSQSQLQDKAPGQEPSQELSQEQPLPDTPEVRSLSEIEADVFEDLMLTSDPVNMPSSLTGTGIEGVVRITIPALTLMHECDLDIRVTGAAYLQGHGPIDTETARKLAAGAKVWERVLTDPVSGLVLAVDKYEPTVAMRRHLNVRDEHCRFPSCRRVAEQTEKDHTLDWQFGGKTEIPNLASLCKGHHSLKHAKFSAGTRWRVTQKPNSDLEWISPLGTSHTDRPRSTVAFRPASEILAMAVAQNQAPPPF